MYYAVRSVEPTDDSSAQHYITVDFWRDAAAFNRGDDPVATEGISTPIPDEGSRIITDGRGFWKLTDGSYIDPDTREFEDTNEYAREPYTVDKRDMVTAAVDRMLARKSRMGNDAVYSPIPGIRTKRETVITEQEREAIRGNA